MRILDLFSGLGGFSLGLERAGMRTVAFCEIDPYCRAVLRKHWPDVPIFEDVRTLHWTGRSLSDGEQSTGHGLSIDVICGGPPCQRTSVAAAIQGVRTGETMWPWMRNVINRFVPTWAVIEQPPGNKAWEKTVADDLEGIGYHTSRFERSSASVGGFHVRRRVFIVAHAVRERCEAVARLAESSPVDGGAWTSPPRGAWRTPGARDHRMDDGISDWVDRIKALGNAVDPRVTELIGRAIMQAEGLT